MGTLNCSHSPPIYRHLVCELFINNLMIMPIPMKIYRHVCDPLSPYILLVNNFITPITPYWSSFINYLHQHIY